MKKLSLCFFIIACFAPLVVANGASRVIPSLGVSTGDDANSTGSRDASVIAERAKTTRSSVTPPATNTDTVTARDTSARAVVNRSGATQSDNVSKSDVVRVGSRVLNINGTSTPTTSGRGSTNVRNTGAASRVGSAQVHTNTARENLEATVNTVGRNSRVEAASINNNPAVRRAGLTLRPSTAEVGGRATIAGTDIQTGSNIDEQIRGVQTRAATNVPTTESIAEAKERLDLTSDLNASCQQQYNDCMDQFCNVIDANQGRCSCSANLANYTDVEEAVTDANNKLNEVAQQIRYVGLTADEIRAIMSETEAEAALSGAKDTSETRNMLEEIEKLIRDPSGSSSTYSSNSVSLGLDMDLDFSSDIADIFNLDFLNLNTGSFSNLRGTSLYNAAKNRCRVVLNQCEEAGANIDQITANYDLAIDKDCIAYEQGLTKMNQTLVSNVRSANLMLQKARLAVLQNKNQYDAKGCIAALDTCMTDEMVCGADYTKCLDPTKRYIDENGNVVLGQDITNILDFMETYNNANINKDFLSDSYKYNISIDNCKETPTATSTSVGVGNNGACIVKYLLQKIGTKEVTEEEGLCRAVLNKCQAYTYDDDGKYQAYNDIVVNYIQRAMVNIQAAQRQIISDYASNCMLDVANCYNQQVTQVNAWSTSASVSSIYNVMRGACRNVALTCAYAVFANDTLSCPDDAGQEDTCIESISQMFYQSLLCPDNSKYDDTCMQDDGNLQPHCVNSKCKCLDGYEPWAGTQCLRKCPTNAEAERNAYGQCVCKTGYTMRNGLCISDNPTSGTDESGTRNDDTGG